MIPTAGGGLTKSSSAGDLVSLGGTELFFTVRLTPDLGALMAAIGVIRIANESKQAMNTLRLLGVGSGDNFFTANYF